MCSTIIYILKWLDYHCLDYMSTSCDQKEISY
jgi:hypothetical protein